MKTFFGVATFLIVCGCGIMSLIFDLPERYIQRDVKPEEIIGTWSVTAESESDINDFAKTFPDWGVSIPWKTIAIDADGTCTVQLEISWLGTENTLPSDVLSNNMVSCTWNLTEGDNMSGNTSPVIEFDFEYPDNYSMRYYLYIFEENEKLILWNFIGDPDDFRPQDFVKEQQ
jgi:hypothetical protein